MGFAYTFTENNLKPIIVKSPWLPECASGLGMLEMNKEGGSFCEANPESCGDNENIGNVFSTMMIIQLFAKRIQMTQCVLEETL